MSFHLSKPSEVLIWTTLAAAPFAVWLLIYWVLKYTSVDPRKLLPILKILRVITWPVAMGLTLLAVVDDSFRVLFVFGFGILSFSTGLSFPQSWLKKKLGLNADTE